jgi:predicted nucleic acid-binding Zn ribbon protein
MREPPEYCANCGAEIPRNARACPECGADERTGWAEADPYDGLDLPLDDETLADDENQAMKRKKRSKLTWLIAAFLVVVFVFLAVRGWR